MGSTESGSAHRTGRAVAVRRGGLLAEGSEEFDGEWWLARAPERRVRGVLTVAANGRGGVDPADSDGRCTTRSAQGASYRLSGSSLWVMNLVLRID